MKKLLLIQPTATDTQDNLNYSKIARDLILEVLPKKSKLHNYLINKKALNLPSLSMGILAALTPDTFEIQFIDEKVEPIDFNCGADLVAITATTTIANRAYNIAEKFKQNGAKVVMGGVHVSALPKEALQYADAVCVGEAELMWGIILKDFKKGKLKEIYKANRYLNLQNDYIPPDISIFKKDHYLFDTIIELSRGCPYNCNFCSDDIIFGKHPRTRSINDVISQIDSDEREYTFFADNNLFGNSKRAIAFLKEYKKLNRRWAGSVPTSIANHPDIIDLIIESGCKLLVIGFESISHQTLKNTRKTHNHPEKYSQLIKNLQEGGVIVAGSFISGFDDDSLESLRAQKEFVEESGLLLYLPGVLTPYPGTRLHSQFESQERLLHKDWDKYNVRLGEFVFSGHSQEYQRAIKQAINSNGFYNLLKIPDYLIKKISN